jgi:cytochrome P450
MSSQEESFVSTYDKGSVKEAGAVPEPAPGHSYAPAAQAQVPQANALPLPPFKRTPVRSSFATVVSLSLMKGGNLILRVSRALLPVFNFFGLFTIVTRYEHVAEVLSRHDVFEVPFGAEIARLNDGRSPGTPFLLGIDDETDHEAQLKLVLPAFARADVSRIVAPLSRRAADRALSEASSEAPGSAFDAISKLITNVPVDVCIQYYGVPVEDRLGFAHAAIELSGYLFGLPPLAKRRTAQVEAAGKYVRAAVDRAMQAELERPDQDRDTVLARLVGMHREKPEELGRSQIRSFVIGMIVGFVPTNTVAGGHILEMLLSRDDFMHAALTAARKGDDDLLKHCLFEAMRFMPLNPGPFRICKRDFVLGANSSRPKLIRAGKVVLASTPSAMFDPRQIDDAGMFKPGRPASDYMLFGHGMHFCAGVFIAQAQITQTFKALLLRGTPRRAGPLQRHGLFPARLPITLN